MSTNTGIEWTDATWNPIRGCSRVSEGCRHCYAETIAGRFSGVGGPFEGLVTVGLPGKKSTKKWNGKIRFVEEHLLDPLKWKKPRMIFVNSMSDLYHENVTDEMRDKIYAVMGLCPQHTFQVLTKRPERRLEYLGNTATMQRVREAMIGFQLGQLNLKRTGLPVSEWSGMPLPNVWEGVSIEDQPTADARLPLLLETPAAERFISAEPLLGSINLKITGPNLEHMDTLQGTGFSFPNGLTLRNFLLPGKLDWVIVGGESGPGARPMHPDWARSLRDQCKAAGVPFFFKQWGNFGAGSVHVTSGLPVFRQFENKQQWINKGNTWVNGGICIDADGKQLMRGGDFDTARYPVTIMHPMPKKAAGALLDGVEHREFPEVRT